MAQEKSNKSNNTFLRTDDAYSLFNTKTRAGGRGRVVVGGLAEARAREFMGDGAVLPVMKGKVRM